MTRWLLPLLLTGFLSAQAHAAISFVEDSTANNSSANTLTANAPAGTAENDLVIAFACINATGGTWTDPVEFTQIHSTDSAAFNCYIGYDIEDSTPAATYEFTSSSTAAAITLTLVSWRGVDTSTPFDVAFVAGSHFVDYLNDITSAAAAITTVTNGAEVVLFQHWNGAVAGITLGRPSGYTSRSEVSLSSRTNFVNSIAKPTFETETPGAYTTSGSATIQDSANWTLALRPATGSGFAAGPTVAAATNGYTIAGTHNASVTVYAVALDPAAAAPTCTQIQEGTDADGNVANAAASEAWTGSVADSFLLTAAGIQPRNYVYVCANDGIGDVDAFADEDRSADTDQTITGLISISATSPFAVHSDTTGDTTADSAIVAGMTSTAFLQAGMRVDVSAGFACDPCIVEEVTTDSITLEEDASSTESNVTVSRDAYFSPAVASGDVIEGDNADSLGGSVAVATDGDMVITCTPSPCENLLRGWDYNIQDVSGAGDFTAGPPAWADGDDTLYFGNERPDFNLADLGVVILLEDVEMTSIDLAGLCDDELPVSITVRSGTLPSGTSLSDGIWSGTPDTEEDQTLNVTCHDAGQLYATAQDLDVYVRNTVAVPDYTAGTLDQAITAHLVAFPWQVDDLALSATFACNQLEAANEVVSQDPAAGTEVLPSQPVSVLVANECSGAAVRRRR